MPTFEQLKKSSLNYLHRRAVESGVILKEDAPELSAQLKTLWEMAEMAAGGGQLILVEDVMAECEKIAKRWEPQPTLQGFVHPPLTEEETVQYLRLFNHPRVEDLEMFDVPYHVPPPTEPLVINYRVDADDEEVLKLKPGTQQKLFE